MRIYTNGIYRDMTPEEEAEYLAGLPTEESVRTAEERLTELEAAIEALLSGVTE